MDYLILERELCLNLSAIVLFPFIFRGEEME